MWQSVLDELYFSHFTFRSTASFDLTTSVDWSSTDEYRSIQGETCHVLSTTNLALVFNCDPALTSLLLTS